MHHEAVFHVNIFKRDIRQQKVVNGRKLNRDPWGLPICAKLQVLQVKQLAKRTGAMLGKKLANSHGTELTQVNKISKKKKNTLETSGKPVLSEWGPCP